MAYLSNANVLRIRDGERLSLIVRDWVVGDLDIRPATGPGVLRVRALRLFLAPPWRDLGIDYVDVTGQQLVETLLPWLGRAFVAGRVFELHAQGFGVARRFGVRVGAPPEHVAGQGGENAAQAIPAV
jgi:hypothetical protein